MPAYKIDSGHIEKVLPNQAVVKYKDIFDLKSFYESLRFWFQEYGWDSVDGGEHYETYYDEKIDPGGSKEIWIRWRLVKSSPATSKMKYHLDLDFHALGIKGTEVIRDGVKHKAHKGEVEVKINALIEKLYEKEFSSGFLGILKQTLDFEDPDVEERKKELYQEVYVLQNYIKQWFKLRRFLPYEETRAFHDSKAFPSHIKQ